MKILIVEDEIKLLQTIEEFLLSEKHIAVLRRKQQDRKQFSDVLRTDNFFGLINALFVGIAPCRVRRQLPL